MTHTPDPRPAPQPGDRPRQFLDGDAALDLLLANTGPGQTVLDFDHDPVLRAAARTTGRRYRALPLSAQTPGTRNTDHGPGADLVVLTWPRPHAPHPTAGRHALDTAAAAVTDGGHVAILLEPTLPQTYTITWTGAVLATARTASLDYLQDIVCLHTPGDPTTPVDNASTVLRQQHRIVLVLRPAAGRHA
jgi:hypothetical protein